MLLNYEFENFRSFRNPAKFSMIAPNTKVKNRFTDNYVQLRSGYDVLKTAVIVGENAGGKSNFVHSCELLKFFFTNNDNVVSSKRDINSNNTTEECPMDSNTTQRYSLELSDEDDVIYQYLLEYDFIGIIYESLSLTEKKGGKCVQVFHAKRDENSVNCDKKAGCNWNKCMINGEFGFSFFINEMYIKGFEKDIFKSYESDKNIGLFVTKLAILGCTPAVKFTSLIRSALLPESNVINYDLYKSLRSNQDDLEILKDERYFEIFRLVDYSIVRIEVDDEKPFTDSTVYRKGRDGREFPRKLRNDSSGVREFFAWAIQVFKVIHENKTVIADEMDRVLNPVLSERVISFINGSDHKGQFIFTTHNVMHLDLRNYMKEQIYFVTKDIETLESEMYSLSEFPEVRYETAKVYEFYLKGILGGTASE
ncbi:MAG: ATP-binding protein [Solobacterium sp.]|nr:ATP-binding protein [Solobacterium sp.]